jgi:hypothetical protein
MAAALASSIIDTVTGLVLGSAGPDTGNRLSLEGLSSARGQDGALEIRIRSVALSGVKVQGPLVLAPGEVTAGDAAASSWSLGPLATADGTIRAKIIDAQLLFDADVTVPMREGQVDFNHASVEHVGPDSRMGVSRLGLYVDAPNGRSYLYQFSSAPLAGVEYERRGALLGPWVTHRGSLQLQAFVESLLRQAGGGLAKGFTEQSRLLFDRTAISGDVQLGDGKFAAPGVQAELAGRTEGRNVLRVHSEAVGRGLTAEMPSLSVRNVVLGSGTTKLRCDAITGSLKLQVLVDGAKLRFAFEIAEMKITGLTLDLRAAGEPAAQ